MALALPTLSLAPTGQAERPEKVDLGKDADCRQYQRVLSVAESQARRLCHHGALRERPGYDFADEFIDDARVQELLVGAPCLLTGTGTGAIAAYLGACEVPGKASGCRMRLLRDGSTVLWERARMLPLPTRPPQQGDWVLAVGLPPEQQRLYGRRGFCTVGVGSGGAAPAAGPEGYWVGFEPSDETHPYEMVYLPSGCLAALPMPSSRLMLTPWEARRAQDSQDHEDALPLVDEAELERRSLLRYGHDEPDSPSTEGSQSLGLSDGDDSGSAADARVSGGRRPAAARDPEGRERRPTPRMEAGTLVKVAQMAADGPVERHGRLEGPLLGPYASIRLLGSPAEQIIVEAGSVAPSGERDLLQAAACGACGGGDAVEELLLCERFGQRCLGAAHLACLAPPLKAVPEGPWFCELCGDPGEPPAAKRRRAAPAG